MQYGICEPPLSRSTCGRVVSREHVHIIPRHAEQQVQAVVPKAPCAHIVYTLALKYLYRDPFKA